MSECVVLFQTAFTSTNRRKGEIHGFLFCCKEAEPCINVYGRVWLYINWSSFSASDLFPAVFVSDSLEAKKSSVHCT